MALWREGRGGDAVEEAADADEDVTTDDDDEYDEAEGGNRLLGFMFGNVDDSGDLDVDYLDEDAKEHLAALADKLGSSLKDIDLSIKSTQVQAEATDQDYDTKAENAIDYEDIDEEYEGPEVENGIEEEHLLPKKDFFPKEMSLSSFGKNSVLDDDNYDFEDDDFEKQKAAEGGAVELSASGERRDSYDLSSLEQGHPDVDHVDDQENPDMEEDVLSESEESFDGNLSSLLPVLYTEDGKTILRFSEIFGIHEPSKRVGKRDHRYIVPREKLRFLDTSGNIEEDEEVFLKEPCRDLSWLRKFQKKFGDLDLDDGNDIEELRGNGGSEKKLTVHEFRESYASAEPMKDGTLVAAVHEQEYSLSPQFYPLDQQDWEEGIVWNDTPSPSDSFVESCELSGPDCDAHADTMESAAPMYESELQSKPHDKHQLPFIYDSSCVVEPFSLQKLTQVSNHHKIHPQLLRLEPLLDPSTSNAGSGKDPSSESQLCSAARRRFSELALQNNDINDGSWLDSIIWEPNQPISKPKRIYDLQDERMLFELLDLKDGKHIDFHSVAMIVSRPVHSMGGEQHNHGALASGRFNISNDKFYAIKKSSQQLRSHSKKRPIQGLKVLHSVPALKLQTMKAKLSNKDIANFHRPKAVWYPHDIEVPFKEQGRLPPQGAMKVILKSLGGKGSKLHVDDEEAVSSFKVKASKKLDFKLSEPVKIFFSGRELEENKSLVEQNVRPNSVLHLIRTKIHLLPRAQKLPRENKSLRPPGAFKKKSDLSVKDGHVYLMEYCEERPLLLGDIGMGARLCTYYQKSSPADQMGSLLRVGNNGLGSVVVLDPADKSPFIGDIRSGSSQTCLETNMYRAPIFQHKVPSTDYLLVRSSKGKLSIRRIDRLDVVGQQEPHIEVMSPGSKNVQFYLMNRLLVYMFREFRASEKRGFRPAVRADELFSQFPSLSEALLRKRLKNCADLQKGPNGHLLWVMKHNFRIPSEEELRRMVTPENVCAYESMQAGLYRLKRLGITRLIHPSGIPSAMNQLPDEAITLAAASHIERELQITPWNLSCNFVACTSQDRENIERLEITGVGDPSGRGLGFSYVRATPKAPISNTTLKKKALIGKGSTVTGTDADLRRLSMEAARELLLKFGVPEEQIAKLTRWHRIALIRKLSSEQAASGVKVDPTMVSKFARGQRMSFLQLQQQTREKCQEIWERQVHSLCSGDGEENETESDANSDLDSFAGDLENLLDAEECEEEEVGNDEAKFENIGGARGLKMRRRSFQTQAEEEIEDEAAEAAELCKMLMDDDETDWKKKKKIKAASSQGGLPLKSRLREGVDGIKKNNSISKRITQPLDSFMLTEKANQDQKGDGLSMQKNFTGKSKPKKTKGSDQMGYLNTKVKILGDAINVMKEKKPARESFICGACGQLGHMRTNKHCPKYGEDSEARGEGADLEKFLSRPSSMDQIEQGQQKPQNAKLLAINGSKTAPFQVQDDDRITTPKAKFLKVKCGPDTVQDKQTPATSQSSDPLVASDAETRKVNKIIFSNKMKSDDFMVESPKPSVGIKPLVEPGRDISYKKNVIRQSNEIIRMDENSQDGSFGLDFRKMKKIAELSSFDTRQKPENRNLLAETSRAKVQEDGPWWFDEKMRDATSQSEEKNRRAGKMRIPEPAYELLRYGESIRREREEEERQRVKAKKKKKRKHEKNDDYIDSFPPKRNDRRILERERSLHRVPEFEYGAIIPDSSQSSKRRRGGEVGLSNILESIVEKLKGRKDISYLFLKPVTRKEAPDYHSIISCPMDLSTIREKVRRMEYKNRDDFREDVYQICYNAHKYNDGRNPGIPPLADQLLELCDYLLEEYDAELAEAEAGIE